MNKRITFRPNGGPAPKAGDGLRGARTAYVIVTSRRINSRDGVERYALGVRVVDPSEHAGRFVHVIVWDKRVRR